MGRPSKFSPEFREQAVELVRATGKTIAEVARDLQINDTTLGNWVKADRAERGEPDSSGLLPLTAEERAEPTDCAGRRQAQDRAGDPEKGGGLLGDRVDKVTRFAFIDREKAHHDVTVLCRMLKVSRTGSYAWLSRPPSARAVADEVLAVQIRAAIDDNRRRVYGAPRIHAELATPACGWGANASPG